ncbi:MAG TPA: hypothetical protein VNV13_15555, partial [Steroidobacteraceae bacterium]|nr:hypothetical protein [Steroidobacteraceae bacterium]
MNQSAPKPAGFPNELELPNVRNDTGVRSDTGVRADAAVRGEIVSHTLKRIADSSPLDRAIAEARDALMAQQHEQGYWLYELEADCTIPAEYIMMMHF